MGGGDKGGKIHVHNQVENGRREKVKIKRKRRENVKED